VIFAVLVTNSNPADDNGSMFEWRVPQFKSVSQFDEYIAECKKRSMFNIPVDVRMSDKIVTLATCNYEFDDARLIVVARSVREDETPDVRPSKPNRAPLYPQAWYDRNGGQRPE